MSLSKSPIYNLKVVLRETGIFADTLRAWERRYGLPMPQRTAGGHRLYSEYDIETIKWLMARQREGLSISRAVDMWNEQNNAGVDPLAGSASQAVTATTTVYHIAETSLDALRAHWLSACLNFNETEAEEVLNQAFAMYPVEKVCTDVLQRGMSEVGEYWFTNRASVQQEHFASALAMRRLDTLLSASPRATRKQTVLIGCPAEEWHTFTTLLLALLLRRRGLNIIYLGANVPAEQFEETVTAVGADLVILVAQTLVSAAELHSTAWTLAQKNVRIGFGGRIFNTRVDLRDYTPGFFLGNTIETSIDEVENILSRKVEERQVKSAPPECLAALKAFNSKRLHIESTLKEMVNPLPLNAEGVNTGIHFLGDNIAAALQLGSMEHVSDEVEWVKTLMHSHNRPPQELAYFMQSYSNAVDQHINGTGTPIKSWLQERARQVQP